MTKTHDSNVLPGDLTYCDSCAANQPEINVRAQDIYTLLVLVIDQACESEGFMDVCEVAGHNGMRGGQVTAFNALKYEYTYSDSDGNMVLFNILSYDPSGPFQNIPDINRFTVKLVIGGKDIAIHDRQYSD